MHYSSVSIIATLLLATSSVLAGSDNVLSYPNNAICVLTNAARFDPKAYSRLFPGSKGGKINCAAGKRGPVYPDDNLAQAATAHSKDMLETGCFDHGTCSQSKINQYGGTKDFSKRIGYYFKESGAVAENIAQGTNYDDPEEVMSSWLESSGHCANIYGSGHSQLGVGTARGSDIWGTRATQNFAAGKRPGNPVVCAGHMKRGYGLAVVAAVSQGNGLTFYAVVDGERKEMKTDLGDVSAGMVSVTIPSKKGCIQYYIEAVNKKGDVVDRYPKKGAMLTQGFGGCTECSTEETKPADKPAPKPKPTSTSAKVTPTSTAAPVETSAAPVETTDVGDYEPTYTESIAPTTTTKPKCRIVKKKVKKCKTGGYGLPSKPKSSVDAYNPVETSVPEEDTYKQNEDNDTAANPDHDYDATQFDGANKGPNTELILSIVIPLVAVGIVMGMIAYFVKRNRKQESELPYLRPISAIPPHMASMPGTPGTMTPDSPRSPAPLLGDDASSRFNW